MSNSVERNIWLVRHGLRMDFIEPQWVHSAENRYNPPLHPNGFIQAAETAARLEAESIDWIFTSPFLRTLQTANIIAEKLNKDFFVEEGFSEWLKEAEFEDYPLGEVNAELKTNFPFMNTDHKSFDRAVYPETRDELDNRVGSSLRKIFEHYEGNILIVSHASPIDAVFRILLNEDPDEYQTMCAVSRLDLASGAWSFGINRDSSHLSIPDNHNKAFYRNYKNP